MSTPFNTQRDAVKDYIQVVIGVTKQRVPILTQSNCADWKRVFNAAVAGTDSEYISKPTTVLLDDDGEAISTAMAEMSMVIVSSEDELISTDEETPEEPDGPPRNASEEEKAQHQTRVDSYHERSRKSARRNRKRQKRREAKTKKKTKKQKKKYYKADKDLKRVLQSIVCRELRTRLETEMCNDLDWKPTAKDQYEYYLEQAEKIGARWQDAAEDHMDRTVAKMREANAPLKYLAAYITEMEANYLSLSDAGAKPTNAAFIAKICKGLSTSTIYDHIIDPYRLDSMENNEEIRTWKRLVRTLRGKSQTLTSSVPKGKSIETAYYSANKRSCYVCGSKSHLMNAEGVHTKEEIDAVLKSWKKSKHDKNRKKKKGQYKKKPDDIAMKAKAHRYDMSFVAHTVSSKGPRYKPLRRAISGPSITRASTPAVTDTRSVLATNLSWLKSQQSYENYRLRVGGGLDGDLGECEEPSPEHSLPLPTNSGTSRAEPWAGPPVRRAVYTNSLTSSTYESKGRITPPQTPPTLTSDRPGTGKALPSSNIPPSLTLRRTYDATALSSCNNQVVRLYTVAHGEGKGRTKPAAVRIHGSDMTHSTLERKQEQQLIDQVQMTFELDAAKPSFSKRHNREAPIKIRPIVKSVIPRGIAPGGHTRGESCPVISLREATEDPRGQDTSILSSRNNDTSTFSLKNTPDEFLEVENHLNPRVENRNRLKSLVEIQNCGKKIVSADFMNFTQASSEKLCSTIDLRKNEHKSDQEATAAYFTIDLAKSEQKEDQDDYMECDRRDVTVSEPEAPTTVNIEIPLEQGENLKPGQQQNRDANTQGSDSDDMPLLRSSSDEGDSTEDSSGTTDTVTTSGDESGETSDDTCEPYSPDGSSSSTETGSPTETDDEQKSADQSPWKNHAAYFGDVEGDTTRTLIVDSGTSAHVISDQRHYSTFKLAGANDYLLGVGEGTKIIGRGNVRIVVHDDSGQPTTILLQDCICITGGVFLLSVKRFALRGAVAVFRDTGSALEIGEQSFPMTLSHGLYVMKTVILKPEEDTSAPSCFTLTEKFSTVMQAHRALGHLNLRGMKNQVRNGTLTLPYPVLQELLKSKTLGCNDCPHGKAVHSKPVKNTTRVREIPPPVRDVRRNAPERSYTREDEGDISDMDGHLPFSEEKVALKEIDKDDVFTNTIPTAPATIEISKVHVDTWGPLPASFKHRFKHLLGFVVYPGGFCLLQGLHHLDAHSLANAIDSFLTLAAKFGNHIHFFVSDNWKGFVSHEVRITLDKHGVQHQRSAPHVQEQNSPVERKWRYLHEGSLVSLAQSGLGSHMWFYAMTYQNYTKNRDGKDSFYTKFFGLKVVRPPRAPFGCLAYPLEPKTQRAHKMSSKVRTCVFLGYSSIHKLCYILLDLKTKETIYRRSADTTLIPDTFPAKSSYRMAPLLDRNLAYCPLDTDETEDKEEATGAKLDNATEKSKEVPTRREGLRANPPRTTPASTSHEYEAQLKNDQAADQAHVAQVLKEDHWTKIRKQGSDQANVALEIDNEPDPTSYKEAMNQKARHHWRDGIKKELDTLSANGTYREEKLPAGKKLVKSKFVFKRKRDRDGKIIQYKARGVAKGFSEIEGIDFFDTYAPTMKLASLRLLLATAVNFGWSLRLLDVCAAFLMTKLPDNEVIYMAPFEGMKVKEGYVLRLLRSLYGLRQAAYHWNQNFHETMITLGFIRTDADSCLYVKFNLGRLCCMLGVHVDDITITGNDKEIGAVVKGIKGKYKVTDSGLPKLILGIAVDYNMKAGTLKISQEAAIRKIVNELGMKDCKPMNTPALTTRLLTPEAEPDQEETLFMTNAPYRSVVGSLTYIFIGTRPDIGFALSQCARHSNHPRMVHWQALKRIVRYLKGTADFGICYVRGTSGGVFLKPNYWSDADHAGDIATRKSQTGFVSMLLGGPITYKSRRQKSVALSSFGAELMALGDALQDALWIRRVLSNCSLLSEEATVIYEDNQGTIAVSKQDPGSVSSKTKHIAVRYFFVREHVECGDITVIYCCTEEMVADIFTKPLGATKFKKFREMLGIRKLQ